ncbi:MAG: hypothetical protein ACXVB0_18275 [Mucilaginibacter sp.]
MTDYPEIVFAKLMSIKNRHRKYFEENDLYIFACVVIDWGKPITIKVTHKTLPPEIKQEIEDILKDAPPQL